MSLDQRFELRCTAQEKTDWQAKASAAGYPLSNWIRLVVLGQIPSETPQIAQDQPKSTKGPDAHPVRFESPTLNPQPRIHFKASPSCSGRCKRIGIPACHNCRKTNPH